jgi:predicted transcriptional regulator
MTTSFEEMVKQVQETNNPVKITPKQILTQLQVRRRGWRVVEAVSQLLEKYELSCEPDFGTAWAYGEVEIKPKPRVHAKTKKSEGIEEFDPTPRISMLRAANLTQIKENNEGPGLISVTRETKLSTAITIMMNYKFSQLPILSGRTVEGLISWRSIGHALALGRTCETVMDCKEDVLVLDDSTPLFEAANQILEKEVVLIKSKARGEIICGIITATDLGKQFITLAEPFLIIEQIENHLRKLLSGKFTKEQISKAIDPNDAGKDVNRLEDLNFGAYIRIVEKEENFNKLGLKIDRKMFIQQLNEVREIRNDVMHFDPDWVDNRELDLLRQTANFLASINSILRRR